MTVASNASLHSSLPSTRLDEDTKYNNLNIAILNCRKEIKELRLRFVNLGDVVNYRSDIMDQKLKYFDSKNDISLPFVTNSPTSESKNVTYNMSYREKRLSVRQMKTHTQYNQAVMQK